MLNKEDFELNYQISDELKKQNKIKFKSFEFPKNPLYSKPDFNNDSVEVSLEDIHRLSPVFNSTNIDSCIVFWDDIVQFTTLGALDLFKELVIDTYEKEKNIPDDKKFEFEYFEEQFFSRSNDLISGEKFMYIALNSTYSLTQIERFFRKFYYIILTKSPMSGIIPALGTSIHMLKKVIFLFKYPISDLIKQKLKDDLFYYWDIRNADKNIYFYNLDEINEEDIYLKHTPSVIFTPRCDITLPILVKNQIKNVEIFTHIKHNGLSPEFLEQYVLRLKMSVAPGFNKIYFYDDQIHIEDPNIYNDLSDEQERNLELLKERKKK